jgi:light-harvesting protein B-800-850 alpha chain
MNNGRIWCVVKPTVGLPLFLGGVAVIALLVHASVLTNTTWMSDYWKGSSRARAAAVEAPRATPAGFNVSVVPATGAAADGAAFMVTVTPAAGADGPVLASAEAR